MSLVLQRMPLNPPLLKRLTDRFAVHTFGLRQPTAELAPDLRQQVDVVFTAGNCAQTGADMDLLPNLKLIACMGSGYEAIDVAAARERGIAVSNCLNTNHECVADVAWGLILAVGRHMVPSDAFVRAGKWTAGEPGYPRLLKTVHGSRLGIIGLGAIGREVALRAAGFRMDVAWTGRAPKADAPWRFVPGVEELASWADFLVVSLRASDETRHIVNERVMRALGPEGVLINISRGSTVDEDALARGLAEGWLGGAGLDVYENEPRIHPGLLDQPKAVLLPHIGGWTWHSFEKQVDLVGDNIAAVRAGRPPVTPVG
jgi:lactate dehydrogenase-like 2-hydroxyacid dehydrogenase